MKTRTPEQEAAYQRGFELARRAHQRLKDEAETDAQRQAPADVAPEPDPTVSASSADLLSAPEDVLAEYTSDDLRAHFALGWIHAS
jgi:hypothetical protein